MHKVNSASYLEYKLSMSCDLLVSLFSESFSAAFRSGHTSVDRVRYLASLITLAWMLCPPSQASWRLFQIQTAARRLDSAVDHTCMQIHQANGQCIVRCFHPTKIKQWSLSKRNAELTSPLTSKKRGNVLKTSVVLRGSCTRSWRYCKVIFIFWNTLASSGEWTRNEMASLQASPSSCSGNVVANLRRFGPDAWATVAALAGRFSVFLDMVLRRHAKYPVPFSPS